jgi:hypothetical protein
LGYEKSENSSCSGRGAGDGTPDITELERVKFVMKGGAVVKNELGGDQQ